MAAADFDAELDEDEEVGTDERTVLLLILRQVTTIRNVVVAYAVVTLIGVALWILALISVSSG